MERKFNIDLANIQIDLHVFFGISGYYIRFILKDIAKYLEIYLSCTGFSHILTLFTLFS